MVFPERPVFFGSTGLFGTVVGLFVGFTGSVGLTGAFGSVGLIATVVASSDVAVIQIPGIKVRLDSGRPNWVGSPDKTWKVGDVPVI